MSSTPMQLVAEARTQITEIDPQSAWDTMSGPVQVLDVREAGEFEAGRIPGAINIPRGILEFRIGEVQEFVKKDTPILIYCRTGGRAALATIQLAKLGYSDLKSITGGIMGWQGANLPVETEKTNYF
ncbi:MAG: rhodanese-like domain-containing protein [Betaproteobacteria bacterium]|nr:MAG: rhodanese-like domain-containing protein [Betaproteobacteria bacterium]